MSQKTHTGILDEKYRYASIGVDLYLTESREFIKELKAFIDTGASVTCVDERILEPYINLNEQREIQAFSLSGTSTTKQIFGVFVRLNPLMAEKQFIPLGSIKTCKLENGYQVIIGNDILCSCEFSYDGINKTYALTFQEKKDSDL